MNMKDVLQKITRKRSANTTRDVEKHAGLPGAQTLEAGKMTTLTAKDLEGVQGGHSIISPRDPNEVTF